MLDRLVEKNERSRAEQRAGEIEPLRLAERQHVLADPAVEPIGEAAVEFHGGQRQPAVFISGAGREQIFANRIRQDRRIVQAEMRRRAAIGAEHHDPVAGKLAVVVVADPAGDLLEQRRLSGAAGADKGCRMPGTETRTDRAAEAAAIGCLARHVPQRQLLQYRRRKRRRRLGSGGH